MTRTRSTGGGGGARRPASPAGRGRTTAAREGAGPARATSGGGRGPGNGGRPPGGGGRGPGGNGKSNGGRPRGSGKAARSKQQRRRRRLKIAAGVLFGLFVLAGVFIGVVYASTEVPSPDSFQNKQTTVVYYQDGTTEMARLGEEDRTNVKLDQVSEAARNAVLAAENRNFYSDPGISFTGIVRAAWNNLTGGSTQGGSTITQQYVKNAYLTADQTLSRKFQELFLAIKLDNNFTKDEILENYLNTIYFGRGAYGIESAADTYFGVNASDLTPEQGAVLAVLVRSPSTYDPEDNPEGAQDRWELVLDGMVEEGWLNAAERGAMTYPEVLPRAGSDLGIPSGPTGLIVQRALAELRATGYSDQQLEAGGLKITTTVDRAAQTYAEEAVAEVMEGEDEVLREALVAIDPKTGAVRAYYGGESGVGTDYARAYRQPGSSMKPYVLATALEQGIGVNSRRDGSSPQTFDDREAPVRNSGGVSCPYCTLREAMTQSLNTTFYGLAYEVGPQAVAETARKVAGLPETWQGGFLEGKTSLTGSSGTTGSAIGIGEYEMRPIDQAHGFATFAAGGVERDPFFARKVVDSEGTVLLDRTTAGAEQRAVSEEVANDVTYALTDVADYANRSLDDGRDVAAKTGTQGLDDENNSDAWIVGYTPSIATSVWIGTDQRDPIINSEGGIIYGSGLPGQIWETFMNRVLEGTPEEDLPDSALIEGDSGDGVVLPEPDPVPEPEPTPTQQTQAAPTTTSQAPAPTPTEEVVGTPPSETVEPPPVEVVPTETSSVPTSSAAAGTSASPRAGAAGTRGGSGGNG